MRIEQVQHRGLRETSQGDVDAVCLVVAAVDKLFPKFSYKWLADEVERNLPKELDFLHEASNSRRCRKRRGGEGMRERGRDRDRRTDRPTDRWGTEGARTQRRGTVPYM